MHEFGIASSVLDAVRRESEMRGGARVAKVGIRVGELAAVDPDSLRFCFEALVSGSDLAPLDLDVEFRPRSNRCLRCGEIFRAEFPLKCPHCDCAETEAA